MTICRHDWFILKKDANFRVAESSSAKLVRSRAVYDEIGIGSDIHTSFSPKAYIHKRNTSDKQDSEI